MKIFATVLLVLTLSATVEAQPQDTCALFGQRNSRGMMMTVNGRFYCDDSLHFDVESTRPIPFNCMGSDTVWCTVCCDYDDDAEHTTLVHYGTNAGEQSFSVSIKTNSQASVGMMGGMNGQMQSMQVYPNPGSDFMRIRCIGMHERAETIEVTDNKGAIVCSMPYDGNDDIHLSTAGWARGEYSVVLKSGASIVAHTRCVITK